MIKIENNDLTNIAAEYKDLLVYWLSGGKKNPDKTWSFNKIKKSKNSRNEYQRMLFYIRDNFDRIITAEPNALEIIISEFNNFQKFGSYIQAFDKSKKKSTTSFGKFKSSMEAFYEKFFSSDYKGNDTRYKGYTVGRWLTARLNVKVCPYCNRQYTFTVNSEEGNTRPQFDHFYPKSKYPFLALSFYNLIPSCPVCNLLKKEKELDHNPYERGFGKDFKFKLETIKGDNNVDWVLEKQNVNITFSNTNNTNNNNIKSLVLENLYKEHLDYVEEIIDKYQAYNLSYYDSLIDSFKGLGKQPAEIDRYIWGTYLEDAEHCNRPLSKLTKDILDQLEIK